MNAPRSETVATRGSFRPKIASAAQELGITIETDIEIGMNERKTANRLVSVAEIMVIETSLEIAIEPGIEIETAAKTTQRATTGTQTEIEIGIVKGLAR